MVYSFRYNDKELDSKNGLNWYDYGARHYDATLGRWHVVDPLAEESYPVSVYSYCENNIVNKNDPTGMSSRYNWDTQRYEDEQGNEVSWEYVQQEYGIAANSYNPNDPPTYKDVDGVTGAAIQVKYLYKKSPVSEVYKIGYPPLPGLTSFKLFKSAKSIWTFSKNISSARNAFLHWIKHSKDFPEFRNAKQYVEGARNFLHKSPSGTLVKIRKNGDILKYHPKSNTFGVMDANGVPRTFFKPKGGITYWENL